MDVKKPLLHRFCGGLTLIELLITLSIAMILMAGAIPVWGSFIKNNALSSARNEMMTAIRYARTTAVIQSITVTLCPSSDQQDCNNDYTSWNDGFIVFNDKNANRRRNKEDTLLRVFQPLYKDISIRSSRYRRSIRYDDRGSAWGSNLTLRFCNPNGAREDNKSLLIYGSGRVRLSSRLSRGGLIDCNN